jgi:hypothetical protein
MTRLANLWEKFDETIGLHDFENAYVLLHIIIDYLENIPEEEVCIILPTLILPN